MPLNHEWTNEHAPGCAFVDSRSSGNKPRKGLRAFDRTFDPLPGDSCRWVHLCGFLLRGSV